MNHCISVFFIKKKSGSGIYLDIYAILLRGRVVSTRDLTSNDLVYAPIATVWNGNMVAEIVWNG